MLKQWVTHPLSLSDETVSLEPLGEEHIAALIALGKDKRIWEYYRYDGTDAARIEEILREGMAQRERGTQYPFVIYDKAGGRIAGTTRLLDMQPIHRKLEIGATWLHPDHWSTAVNVSCKLLLLRFCFEELGTVRVQLKTNEKNMRSRRAIEIGGRYEGILRNDLIGDNGIPRNSAYFSIIDTEWPEVRRHLEQLLHRV